MPKSIFSRREVLRGAGGALIALPALEVFAPKAEASANQLPARVVTVFFGQGLPGPMFDQPAGNTPPVFEGSLEPLAPFADKLALVTGVDHVQAPGDPHDVGPQSALAGIAPRGKQAGGPTIDQVVLEELHPDGSPTRIPTLSTGSYHREGGLARHVHSWKSNLMPAALPIERPDELFRQMFGEGVPDAEPSEEELKQKRYRKSVIDSVRDAYQHAASDASPYGRDSKLRIEDHLERVRELEVRLLAPSAAGCTVPMPPGELADTKAQADERGGGGAGGVDINTGEWEEVWRNLIDIYTIGLRCDITRFGNVIFQSGGDRVRVHGEYRYNGKLIADFDDKETTHEYFHGWRQGGNNTLVEQHVHFIMSRLGYFLERMDAPENADPAGVTLLDDSLVLMTTELSDTSAHSYRNVFHALSGAGGRFKTGVVHRAPDGTKGPDLYNACLQGFGVEKEMGDPAARGTPLTSILT